MLARRALMLFATLATCTSGWTAEKADFEKRKVEASTINVLIKSDRSAPAKPPANQKLPPETRLDIGKGRIEAATEQLLVEQAGTPFQPVAETPSAAPVFENPKVEPGKVRWHANFGTACAASRKSSKPVLLLQMMGNLDDRFC